MASGPETKPVGASPKALADDATKPARLGGARADFVASLGRKVADLRVLLTGVEAEPSARGPRDELRRKLHALGAGARMLRFDAMARCVGDALAVLDRTAEAGTARGADIAHVAQTLDDLPALAWNDEPRSQATHAGSRPESSDGAPTGAVPQRPLSALVLGDEPLAEALSEGEAGFLECERTEDADAAIGMVRALAPDVVVIDSDIAGALELVESLLDDPLTEPVPIIVLGAFASPEQAARFVALGVAKTLSKPVSPGALRNACQDVIDQREGRTMRVTLGEPTLEQLGERLAEEVRRALVESVDGAARACRVPLGEGTEVLGAVWGAIARVREVITQRTDGVVRYSGSGPEGAVALAPWLHHDAAGADRAPRRGRGAAVDVDLDKRVVVVADDDPGVTWFIADLLRTTGCVVHEALDGKRALELAYKHSPQLIVSDILMPELDGFALCRAVRRDVALRDVPVILLSWKEDLLQRVRELGASAAAYLRKESDARAIVARVREVLRPRARVEARLQSDGEVRGRLDDLTVHSLLVEVSRLRGDARVSVRDASFLYEVEIRNGALSRASRTAGDGSFQRGERVVPAMLGVGAGRFVVAPTTSSLPPAAPGGSRARGASGGNLRGTLAEQLARPIALAREAAAATTGARTMNVDRVVLDEDAVTAYLLATPQPARDLIQHIARGASPRAMLLKGEVAPSLLEDVLADLAARGAVLAVRDSRGNDLLDPAIDRRLDSVTKVQASSPMPSSELVAGELPVIAEASIRARTGAGARTNGPPSSLEDAVMRAMSDGTPAAGAHPSSSEQPPIIEPSELRPRSSHPPAEEGGRPLGSLPPDAIVPGSSGDMPAAHPANSPSGRPLGQPSSDPGSPKRPDAASPARATAPPAPERSKTVPARSRSSVPVGRPPTPSLPPPRERLWRLLAVLAVFGFVIGGGIHWVQTPHALPFSDDGPSRTPTETSASEGPVFAPVPADTTVPSGSGLLELTVDTDALVSVDRGPAIPHPNGPLRLPLAAGKHEVHAASRSGEKVQSVEIRDGLATRIVLSEVP